GEIVVQNLPETVVVGEASVCHGLVKARDRPPVHLVVFSVATVDPNHRGLVAVLLGVHRGTSECLHPVGGQAFGVLRVVSMAEGVTHYFVSEHSRVPRAGQFQKAVTAPGSLVHRLHAYVLSGSSLSKAEPIP